MNISEMNVQDRLAKADDHLQKAANLLNDYHDPEAPEGRSNLLFAATVHNELARTLLKSARERTR